MFQGDLSDQSGNRYTPAQRRRVRWGLAIAILVLYALSVLTRAS